MGSEREKSCVWCGLNVIREDLKLGEYIVVGSSTAMACTVYSYQSIATTLLACGGRAALISIKYNKYT